MDNVHGIENHKTKNLKVLLASIIDQLYEEEEKKEK